MTKKESKNIISEVINKKKGLILTVDQSNDYIYPNDLYTYQIYIKNVSGDVIENVQLQVLNPETILIDEDDAVPPQGIPIGDLNNGQSHLLTLKSRCSRVGIFTVHFVVFGEDSELISKPLTINCNYNNRNGKTLHRIHVYDFSPYEEKYELLSTDFNDEFTKLIKKQKLGYGTGQNPFKMIKSDINKNILADESQNFLDQKDILYGTPVDSDEHNYQYINRENFNQESLESYEGETLKEIFDDINENSNMFEAKFLRTGTNELLNDFRQYSPNGLIYSFGLMNSEIFHHLGVIPKYSYMNDYLFRWAAEGTSPLNLYPQKIDMNWDANKWAGHGYAVWKTYTDEYRSQFQNTESFNDLFEYIETFETLDLAEEYINKQYEFDRSNEFYIQNEDGWQEFRKYEYVIKESYFDTGVFFIHIPVNKIPSNFYMLDTDEIEAIVEKTKPYGMKALIKYVIESKFDMHMDFNSHIELKPITSFDLGDYIDIGYCMIPYQNNKIIETVCFKDENDNVVYEDRNSIRMIPDGTGYINNIKLNMVPEINLLDPDISLRNNMTMEPVIGSKVYQCESTTKLKSLLDIKNLLYNKNFDAISFYIENIVTRKVNDTSQIENDYISSVTYKLWVESLFPKNQNPHSSWWDIEAVSNSKNEKEYYFSDMIQDNEDEVVQSKEKVDFFEIILENMQITDDGVETGIGFQDDLGKLHGFSSEFSDILSNFKVKYLTSVNNNFKTIKSGLSDLKGLAFKLMPIDKKTMVIFFIKKEHDGKVKYYYFDHTIVNTVKSLFCFTRSDQDITTITKWSSICRYSRNNNNSDVIFNTPQYDEIRDYSHSHILNMDSTNWTNIHRLDKNEQSYTVIQNNDKPDVTPDDILLHFDNIDIPDDGVVKNIRFKTILESNSYKSIYPSIRIQDGFITEESSIDKMALYPSSIYCYPRYNKDSDYYKEQYEEAKSNDVTESMDLFSSKITENDLFNESLDLSVKYINDIDDYITVTEPHWIQLSDFCNYNIPFFDINEINFCIEGYNSDKEQNMILQLKEKDLYGDIVEVIIPSGYFKKWITLETHTKFTINDVEIRFRFSNLNNPLDIYDTYLEPLFETKQNENVDFIDSKTIDVEKKKMVEFDLIDEEIPGYLLKNGITVKLSFDDLDLSEYYRIYSTELEVVYQKQTTDLIIKSNQQIINTKNPLTFINGELIDNCMCGMIFNELIMASAFQPNYTLTTDNQGIEIEDCIYQQFRASSDNITSITLFPNGFVGNPDPNMVIGIYENNGNTPGKLIKEIMVNGWSKENFDHKNKSMITYDFNVNNLIINEHYWIKIGVNTVRDNSYYLLKYYEEPKEDMRLLLKRSNNLINTFGSLTFYLNRLGQFSSFNSFPYSEDRDDFSDPKIFISLNKRCGELKDIRIRRIKD